MCENFHETMTKVLDDIHRCIRDNPTAEEAKVKLPTLMQQFKERSEERSEALLMITEGEDPDFEDNY
jgi:hypothetical protein